MQIQEIKITELNKVAITGRTDPRAFTDRSRLELYLTACGLEVVDKVEDADALILCERPGDAKVLRAEALKKPIIKLEDLLTLLEQMKAQAEACAAEPTYADSIVDRVKKKATGVKQLLDMADSLRKQAEALEQAATRLEDVPSAFFEDAGRNNNTKLYVSTSHLVGGGADYESLGCYENFVVMELDSMAMRDLMDSIGKTRSPEDQRLIDMCYQWVDGASEWVRKPNAQLALTIRRHRGDE